MPWSMEEWRRTAPAATRDLASVTDFGHAMPEVVERAWRRYLRAARPAARNQAFRPRPRLRDGPHPPGSGNGADPGPDEANDD